MSVFLLAGITPVISYGQYQSFSVQLTAGPNYTDYSIGNALGAGLHLTGQYSPVRYFSVGADIGKQWLRGDGPAIVPVTDEFNTVLGYTTLKFKSQSDVFTYGVSGMINLHSLVRKKAPKRFIPYVFAGGGFMDVHTETEGSDFNYNNVLTYSFYASWYGGQIRFKYNTHFDIILRGQYNLLETQYLENFPYDNKKDGFFSGGIGISYNFSGRLDRPHIDWTTRQIYCPVKDY